MIVTVHEFGANPKIAEAQEYRVARLCEIVNPGLYNAGVAELMSWSTCGPIAKCGLGARTSGHSVSRHGPAATSSTTAIAQAADCPGRREHVAIDLGELAIHGSRDGTGDAVGTFHVALAVHVGCVREQCMSNSRDTECCECAGRCGDPGEARSAQHHHDCRECYDPEPVGAAQQ